MKVLDDYDKMNGKANLSKFYRYVAREYNRPKFQRKTLKYWLKIRVKIEKSSKRKNCPNDRCRMAILRDTVGRYPEMEIPLAARIRHYRSLGMPVETWMVDMEAKLLLHEHLPEQFPVEPIFDTADDETFNFKCRRGWRTRFFKRYGFSLRTIGNKTNKKGVTAGLLDTGHNRRLSCSTTCIPAL